MSMLDLPTRAGLMRLEWVPTVDGMDMPDRLRCLAACVLEEAARLEEQREADARRADWAREWRPDLERLCDGDQDQEAWREHGERQAFSQALADLLYLARDQEAWRRTVAAETVRCRDCGHARFTHCGLTEPHCIGGSGPCGCERFRP